MYLFIILFYIVEYRRTKTEDAGLKKKQTRSIITGVHVTAGLNCVVYFVS